MTAPKYDVTRKPSQGKRMEKLLAAAGISTKRINIYGRQVVVTTASRSTAERVVSVLKQAAFNVRGTVKALDPTISPRGEHAKDRYHDVWRVFATA